MKLVAALLLLCPFTTVAQHIVFPLDTQTVVADGILQQAEWQNAETLTIGVNATDSVHVKYKHTGKAMCFAFSGKLESANALFPEVLTDAANAGGASWSSGQWWFHVSATDCENNGAYGVYNNCLGVQPDWQGGPNFSLGTPYTDTVEVIIPFTKAGFDIATMDTMGLAALVTNTANAFHLFPAGANRNQPASWAKATFSKTPAEVEKVSIADKLSVYPNPAGSQFSVKLVGSSENVKIELYNLTGSLVYSRSFAANVSSIYNNTIPPTAPGIYMVKVETGDKILTTSLHVK